MGRVPQRRRRVAAALVVVGLGVGAGLSLPARGEASASTVRLTTQQHDSDRHHGRWPDSRLERLVDRILERLRQRLQERHEATPAPKPTPTPTPTPTATATPKPTPTATAKPKPKPPPEWAEFTDYAAGQHVRYKGVEYEVREAHTSLPGWEPDALPDLFEQVSA